MKNPMILFSANNQTPVSATISGTFESIYTDGTADVTVPFSIPLIDANQDQNFCLSPINPNTSGTTWIEVSTLPSLITRIPNQVSISVDAQATDTETSIELGKTYSITADYDIKVPFMYGDDMNIVYTDSMSGWHEDLKKYTFKQVNATGYVINKIPLNLNITATALRLNAANVLVAYPDVTATVIVNGVTDGSINSGSLATGTKTAIVVELKEKTTGVIKHLDGLILEANANSKGVSEAILNENQTFQLIDVKLKIPGGLIIDLNE